MWWRFCSFGSIVTSLCCSSSFADSPLTCAGGGCTKCNKICKGWCNLIRKVLFFLLDEKVALCDLIFFLFCNFLLCYFCVVGWDSGASAGEPPDVAAPSSCSWARPFSTGGGTKVSTLRYHEEKNCTSWRDRENGINTCWFPIPPAQVQIHDVASTPPPHPRLHLGRPTWL